MAMAVAASALRFPASQLPLAFQQTNFLAKIVA